MTSRFYMQIVDKKTGEAVQFEPGLTVEKDFVEDCVKCIVARGVGLGRTSAHVAEDIRQGIVESIRELKLRIQTHG